MLRGRPLETRNTTKKEAYEMVCEYVELGNFTEVARIHNINRMKATRNIKKFIDRYPDEYNKILDAYLTRNKQEMIFKNTHTTNKALNKVDELLDDTTSLKEAAMAYGILYDKGALMKGEATTNSAIVIKMAGDVEELSK